MIYISTHRLPTKRTTKYNVISLVAKVNADDADFDQRSLIRFYIEQSDLVHCISNTRYYEIHNTLYYKFTAILSF